MRRLPLFPLGTVLVPGLVLPLRVFEPRYIDLVEHLAALPEPVRELGVVAIRSGHEVGEGNASALYEVGCTARVRRIDRRDDGTVHLDTSGGQRFRLHGLDDRAGTRYLTGLVTDLSDPDGDDAAPVDLARRVGLKFAAYREQLGTPQVGLPASPRVLSYLVAAGMALEVADRQALLEQPDTTARLVAELALLDRERILFAELGAVPATGLTHRLDLS